MRQFNEYSKLRRVAIRSPIDGFVSQDKLDREWRALRFKDVPNFEKACMEYEQFKDIIQSCGAEVIELEGDSSLSIDSIYPRDSNLICPTGLINCNMGRASRTCESKVNASGYKKYFKDVAGEVVKPGILEGGDFIWIDESHAAVGNGPRTNKAGISQLQKILGFDVELMTVDLPQPDHPDDVLHLMSIISPIDEDLAVIYEKFAPNSFIEWLENLGLDFITVSDDEYQCMSCNVLALAPREVVILESCVSLKNKLLKQNCIVHTYKGEEISLKGEGGPTCLTRPLLRI